MDRSTQQEAAIALAGSTEREHRAVCDRPVEFARRLVAREPEAFDRDTVVRFVGELCQGVGVMSARDDLVLELELAASAAGERGDLEHEALLRRAGSLIAVSHHPTEDLTLGFEAVEGMTVPAPGDNMSGACVIRSGVIDGRGAGLGKVPVLMHTFYAGDGVSVLCQPSLVLDVANMRGYQRLVAASVDEAVRRCKR